MGQNHHVIDCSWHQTRSRFENWLKIPRSTVIDLTVSAAVCNICLAHPPSTCLCNGYEETNTVPTQFYFIALFKMEQTQEYLSHGKFQYCNICFCQESDWKFSITVVCLLMGKKKKKKEVFLFESGSVAINLFVDVTAFRMTVPSPPCPLRNYPPPGCKTP